MNPPSTPGMKHFGIGILAGFAGVVGCLTALGVALASFAPERMPAPAISTLVHLDEKLRFIRAHATLDPTILAVGSSVTWRQLDGQPLERLAGAGGFLNGGTAMLQTHQTQALTRFYLDNFPRVKVLLVMVSLPDFSDCTTAPRRMLVTEDAARYAFDHWPAAYFYFRYVSPQRYLRMAMTRAGRQTPLTGDLYLDDYGSGPLQVPEEQKRGLRYDEIRGDPACVPPLERLVSDTLARGVQVSLVFPPIHPEYRARYPEVTAWLSEVAERLKSTARVYGNRVTVVDLIDDPAYQPRDFFDAFHLQWPAVKVLSQQVAAAIDTLAFPHGQGQMTQHGDRQARRVAPARRKAL